MSTDNLWRISHKEETENFEELNNKQLTRLLIIQLREHNLNPKAVALELALPTERVRHWFFRNYGMKAQDLVLLMKHYKFIRGYILHE